LDELRFDSEEAAASDHLMAFMDQLKDWGLDCNQEEWVHAIHTLQLFVIKHMLQRLGAEGFSDWYANPIR
jgi:hypothetical protein